MKEEGEKKHSDAILIVGFDTLGINIHHGARNIKNLLERHTIQFLVA